MIAPYIIFIYLHTSLNVSIKCFHTVFHRNFLCN